MNPYVEISDVLEENGYKILNALGNGPCSMTFRVLSVRYDQVFVCKVVPKVSGIDDYLSLLCSLYHENLVVCFFYFEEKDKIYIILEECPNGNILEYIKNNGPLNSNQLLTYSQQIAGAVAYLHENSVYHLNLKPQNILIDRNGNVKIADIGFSGLEKMKKIKPDTCTFKAPEVLQGAKYSGIFADSWSLGVLYYFMLNGTLPWDISKELGEILNDMKSGLYKLGTKHNDMIEKIISKIMIADPRARMTPSDVSVAFLSVKTEPYKLKKESSSEINVLSKMQMENYQSGMRMHVNAINPVRVMKRAGANGSILLPDSHRVSLRPSSSSGKARITVPHFSSRPIPVTRSGKF